MSSIHRRTALFGLLASTASLAAPAYALQFGLSEGQASNGVRAALTQAARLATEQLGRRDGFFGDPQVRILLPGQVRDVQSMLRRVGLSGQLDQLELQLNRAAESAMPATRRIVVDAVRSMTVQDAIGIVRGGDQSATQFLRRRTYDDLYGLVRPRMTTTLEQSGAYRSLQPIEDRLGSSGGGVLGALFGNRRASRSLRDTVTDEATGRTLDGVFHYIGREEAAIRNDPVSRTSDILRRVFG